VLLALVARPEPGHRSWRIRERLVSEFAHRTRSLQLAALAPVDDGDLLSGVVGDALPDDVRSEMLARAGGNPFYLEELVRSLVSGGVLVEADGRLEFHGTVADLGLPETVEQVIVSRLDRLDPAVRRVLTAASAIGQEFETDLLAAVTGIGDALDDALVELQRLALVREARRWPTPEFRFEHPLIQEAAYAVLVGSDRRDLHRRIVGALSDRPDREGSQARLAHHLERAGDVADAASAYLLAAEDADGRGLIRAAHALSGAGRRVAQRLGDAADPRVVARLWLIHLMSGYFVGQWVPNAEEPMAAVELARRAGDPLTEAQGLSVAAIAHILDGDSTRRRQRFVEALGAARRADDLATLSRSLGRLAIDEANALELDQARARVVEAMELTDGAPVESRVPALDGRKLVALYLGELAELGSVLDELFSFAGEPVFERFRANAVAEAAVLDQALGRVDEALAKADRAIALTEELTGPGDRWMALAVKSRILRSRGSYAEALATGLEAFAGACDMGHGYWLPWTAAEYGTALTEVGAFADAVEVLTRGCTAEQASMPSQQLRCAGTLALAGARAGDAEAGRIGRERFEHLSASMRLPAGRAYLYGADGQLAYAETRRLEGDVEQALFVAGAVAAAADASEWLEGAAHAHLVLGSAALAAGDAHAASLEFSASLERAAPYPGLRWRALAGLAASGAPARLEEARAVIAGLGASVAGDPDGHALTAALADPIAAAGLA
jgi:tetratricopeptide (TPR) repeat protein